MTEIIRSIQGWGAGTVKEGGGQGSAHPEPQGPNQRRALSLSLTLRGSPMAQVCTPSQFHVHIVSMGVFTPQQGIYTTVGVFAPWWGVHTAMGVLHHSWRGRSVQSAMRKGTRKPVPYPG